jgi:hypothetical protein
MASNTNASGPSRSGSIANGPPSAGVNASQSNVAAQASAAGNAPAQNLNHIVSRSLGVCKLQSASLDTRALHQPL